MVEQARGSGITLAVVTARRPLSENERGVLGVLLSTEFPGVAALREQAAEALATPGGCPCGCGTINLIPGQGAPRADGADPMPVGASFTDPEGRSGGVLLFVTDGFLSVLEVYGYDDPPAAPMPAPEWVQV